MISQFLGKVQARVQSFIYPEIDYSKFKKSLGPLRLLARKNARGDTSLLIVCTHGMNIVWAQLFSVLSLCVRVHKKSAYVLTTRSQAKLNRYFKLLGVNLMYLEDLDREIVLPETVSQEIDHADTVEKARKFKFWEAPIGEIALSTYSRNFLTGTMDFATPGCRDYVQSWMRKLCIEMQVAQQVFRTYHVSDLYFTEVFMEEYGAFYFTALREKLTITRFAGTVRDNAIILQHLTQENARLHHASIDLKTWEKLIQTPFTAQMLDQLERNFKDRYANKWYRSKRNHPNTKTLSGAEARQWLGVAEGRKVAVIFSHILYDTLYFFGTDLYKNYADWLIETVKVAIQNPHVDWFIKIHPSNIWRGELDPFLKGKFEETRLIEEKIGALPPHVRLIYPDTPINPYTWFELADYGITVRGTAGLEMAALGKIVVTAGTGRYEGKGFTTDAVSQVDYIQTLLKLETIPPLSQEKKELAQRYAHAIFILKPYALTSFKARLKTGKYDVKASDDLIYTLDKTKLRKGQLPPDLKRISEWITDATTADLLEEKEPK